MARKRRKNRRVQESKPYSGSSTPVKGSAERTLDEILGKHNEGREYKTTHPRTYKWVGGKLVPKDENEQLLEDVSTLIKNRECYFCAEIGDACTCDPKLKQYDANMELPDNKGSQGLLGVTTPSGGLVKPNSVGAKYSPTGGVTTGSAYGNWAGKIWCDHWRDKVELAEGITVLCSAFQERPTSITWEPDIGIYLSDWWVRGRTMVTHSWAGPRFYDRCQMALVDWPDLQTPGLRQTSETIQALDYGLNQAAKGRDVEIGCHGGHGRTGCALAICMMLLGHDAESAMKYVWKNYCNQAIETLKQEEWLEEVAYEMVQEYLNGRN